MRSRWWTLLSIRPPRKWFSRVKQLSSPLGYLFLAQPARKRETIKLIVAARDLLNKLNGAAALAIPNNYIKNTDNLLLFLDCLYLFTGRARGTANIKQPLHGSVRNLYEVWNELNHGRSRRKKEFIEFAYTCLQPANLTESEGRVVRARERGIGSEG